jgi:hypothetical protein
VPGAIIKDFPEVYYERNEVAKIPFLCTTTREEAEFFVLIFKGLGIYKLLLNHWRTAAPSIYDYRRVAANSTATTDAILDFYLNGTNPKDAPSTIFSNVNIHTYVKLEPVSKFIFSGWHESRPSVCKLRPFLFISNETFKIRNSYLHLWGKKTHSLSLR